MSRLICGITTLDPLGNKRRLKVTMHSDGSLTYRLTAYAGSTGFSIGNLYLKAPLPEMRKDTLHGTIDAVIQSLNTGTTKVAGVNKYAQVVPNDATAECPHCGRAL